MQAFNNQILISKSSGNVNRCADEVPFINKMNLMENDMISLRKIKEDCEDVIGQNIEILF